MGRKKIIVDNDSTNLIEFEGGGGGDEEDGIGGGKCDLGGGEEHRIFGWR